MRRLVLSAGQFFAFLLLSASGHAADVRAGAVSSPLPPAVVKEMDDLAESCRGFGGEPGDGHEAVKRGDFNNDGIADYVIYVGDYNCDGAASAMAPTAARGATAILYLGSPNGALTRVWAGDVWGTKVGQQNSRDVLLVDVAGADCRAAKSAKDIASMEQCARAVRFDDKKKVWKLAPEIVAAFD
jgi:hypothetical protein